MENLIWALIIVSGSANVSFSTGYPNKAICEDAISIAKTGMTVGERKAEDEKLRLARAKELMDYQEKNPARATTSEDKKKCHDNTSGLTVFGSSASFCTMEKDGMTRFYPGSGIDYSGISFSSPEREIKYAKCVMVDGKEK